MLRKPVLFFAIAILLLQAAPAAAFLPDSSAESAPIVIGDGTPASCQSETARYALSGAVYTGGTITFDCGPYPVMMVVNTNATDQRVVIDGGGLVTLSGQDLRQIFFVSGSGDLTLRNITLMDGAGAAGAALAVSSPQARATLENCFLVSNDAGSAKGGAIFNKGTLTITGSSLGSNGTTGYGGAVFNDGGQVTIRDSTLTSNNASQGGGVYNSGGSLTIERSAIRSNGAADRGGGLYIDVGTATVVNSTFYDNRAAGGGGIYMRYDFLTVTNSTFNRNRSDMGGALWNLGFQTRLKNTILANSRNRNDTANSQNCVGPAAISQGRNIVSDDSCVPGQIGVGDLLFTDPILDPFIRDNGGRTGSFMPLPGSPAINYGVSCPLVDQRGVWRPVDPAPCDVGSVEVGWMLFLPAVLR